MSLIDRLSNVGRRRLVAGAVISALLLAQAARADLLELTNGDHYRGTVVSMNSTNLEFISEIQGRVILPRSKVAQITLHVVTPRPLAATPPITNSPLILSGPSASASVGASAAGARGGISTEVNPFATGAVPPVVVAPSSSSANAVVERMRQQGMDPKLIDQVQEKIFGKSSPEAAARFNELMGGLMSGQLSIKDIQAQAQHSIDQIRAAKKELGPDAGEMFDGYLDILEKFVRDAAADSTPPVSQSPTASPAPVK